MATLPLHPTTNATTATLISHSTSPPTTAHYTHHFRHSKSQKCPTDNTYSESIHSTPKRKISSHGATLPTNPTNSRYSHANTPIPQPHASLQQYHSSLNQWRYSATHLPSLPTQKSYSHFGKTIAIYTSVQLPNSSTLSLHSLSEDASVPVGINFRLPQTHSATVASPKVSVLHLKKILDTSKAKPGATIPTMP